VAYFDSLAIEIKAKVLLAARAEVQTLAVSNGVGICPFGIRSACAPATASESQGLSSAGDDTSRSAPVHRVSGDERDSFKAGKGGSASTEADATVAPADEHVHEHEHRATDLSEKRSAACDLSDGDTDSDGNDTGGAPTWLALDDPHVLARVLADPGSFFAPFRAVALFPELEQTAHSCAATATATAATATTATTATATTGSGDRGSGDGSSSGGGGSGAIVCRIVPRSDVLSDDGEAGAALAVTAAANQSFSPPTSATRMTVARLDPTGDLDDRTMAFYSRAMWARAPAGEASQPAPCSCNRCMFERGVRAPTDHVVFTC
jgi:hypothetical protein